MADVDVMSIWIVDVNKIIVYVQSIRTQADENIGIEAAQ